MNLKNTLLLFTTFLFCCRIALAQISENEKSMSLGLNNSLTLELPDAEGKFVEKLWKKYIRQYSGKTKRNRKEKEYFTENARIKGIGDGEIHLYSRVTDQGNDAYLTCWFDTGEGFVSSYDHPDQYTEAEKELMRFALEVTREKIKLELNDEEDKLKKLNKNLKKLERSNDSYHREIEQAKERIRKAEANIEQNEIDQQDTRSAIELQEQAVEKVRKRLGDL